MLNAFFRDIRSIRAHENIGVHAGLPYLSNVLSRLSCSSRANLLASCSATACQPPAIKDPSLSLTTRNVFRTHCSLRRLTPSQLELRLVLPQEWGAVHRQIR